MKVERIRTGGQSGVDIAGWRAAKATGFDTCGVMPLGFLTLGPDGKSVERHPEFAELYGAEEHISPIWNGRTIVNVCLSTAIILMGDPTSLGSYLTAQRADSAGVPFIWVPMDDREEFFVDAYVQKLRDIRRSRHAAIRTPCGVADIIRAAIAGSGDLMVAGNRERTDPPTVGPWAEAFLIEVFRLLKARQA